MGDATGSNALTYTGPYSMLKAEENDHADSGVGNDCHSSCKRCDTTVAGQSKNRCTECNTGEAFVLWNQVSGEAKSGLCKTPTSSMRTRCVTKNSGKEFNEGVDFTCTKPGIVEVPIKLD